MPDQLSRCREDFDADGVPEQWREHPWDDAQINPAAWQNTSYWLNQVCPGCVSANSVSP